jgi:threonyl-tRNA synthetase
MRMLILHVDYFKCTLTERGRSRFVEEPASETTSVDEALLVLVSVEKQDESNPERVATMAVVEMTKLGHQLKVGTIVIHPFAHLFGELSSPETAVKTLKLVELGLNQNKFTVVRTPFGWFNALELRAKGHPLSRISRRISLD